MEVLHEHCAGLDVHKKTVVACFLQTGPKGRSTREISTFGTTTPALLRLLDWLAERGVTHVAMESTGEYWRPIYNLLEGHFELLVVNAQHIKAVPGRKTDVNDAHWIADLLRHGLLKGSFIPPQPQRDLRALTRQRSQRVEERVRVVNRLQKGLEDANLKLASVVSDVMGVSSRAMLDAILKGETDAEILSGMARGRMTSKREALIEALTGRVRDHHRFLIQSHLSHIDFLEEQIRYFDREIEERMDPIDRSGANPPTTDPAEASCDDELETAPSVPMTLPTAPPRPGNDLEGEPASVDKPKGSASESKAFSYADGVALLDPIPGIDARAAQAILAEIGLDMGRFPTASHLSSWAGVAPGNYQSAGKSYSGRTRGGNPALRKALVQAAHAAVRKKDSYFGSQYHRIAARRGKQRAFLAVAHSLLVIIYHVLRKREAYQDLGADYFDKRSKEAIVQRMVGRLSQLGFQVNLEPQGKVLAA
jgi:transposase